jgi:hypothetical protein
MTTPGGVEEPLKSEPSGLKPASIGSDSSFTRKPRVNPRCWATAFVTSNSKVCASRLASVSNVPTGEVDRSKSLGSTTRSASVYEDNSWRSGGTGRLIEARVSLSTSLAERNPSRRSGTANSAKPRRNSRFVSVVLK